MSTPMFRMNASVRATVDNSANILQAIRVLEKADVLVGVPAEKAPRDPNQAKGSSITNVTIAYINNFGSPALNIPARPFMDPGIKDAQPEIESRFKDAGTSAFEGNAAAVTKNFMAAGLIAATSIKRRIVVGPFVPLKPSTLAARRRRGFLGTFPLNETGQLKNAITYVIRSR